MRQQPRWPEIETAEHPPWVDKALNDLLPALAFLVPLTIVRWLDIGWLTATFVLTVAAYVLFFGFLPWMVRLGREFMAGYRGTTARLPQPGPPRSACR
ncbi:MAG: hypothetical protein ACXVWW_02785 [Nocardioides sp.]